MPVTLEAAGSAAGTWSESWSATDVNVARSVPRARFGSTRQIALTAFPLVLSDLAAVAVSVLTAHGILVLAATTLSMGGANWDMETSVVLASMVVGLFVSNAIFGLYPGTGLHPMVELRTTCLSVLLTNCVLLAALLPGAASIAVIVHLQLAILAAAILLPLSRTIMRDLCARVPGWGQAALVLGDGDSALRIFDAMQRNPDRGLRPVGILGDPMTFSDDLRHYPYSGPVSEAPIVAQQSSAYWAVVAMPDRPTTEVGELVNEFAAGIPNVVVTTADEIPTLWSHAFSGLGLSGMYFQRGLLLPLPRFLKRGSDILACAAGGVLILPLMAMIAGAIWVSSPGPIFFKQRRIGQGGRYFMAWKFRTMVADASKVLDDYLNANPEYRAEWEADHKLRNDPRITRIGHWLRRTSLDELPQIWNALKGEMSLVGPRPIVDDEVVKYGRDFELYASVLPGITGLWQVSGRNDTTYEERVQLDSYYVRNWSPWMDLYILFKTISVLLTRKGAY